MRTIEKLLAATIAVCLIVPTSVAQEDKLPAPRSLIAEALKLCPQATDEDSYPRCKIAQALAHLGDFDAARKILAAHKNDIWIETGYWTLAEAEIARGKVATPFPKALFDELPDYPHLILAYAYAEHGQIERALEHVKEMPATRASSLHLAGYRLVEILKNGGHDAAAREVLLRWAECLANTESIYDYKPRKKIEQLTGWLHDSGEIAKAKALCDRWHAILAAEIDLDENGEFIGIGWTHLAGAFGRIGEQDRALNAIREARN